MPDRVVELELHPGDVTSGEWCPRCLLPSAIRVHMVLADATTLAVVGRLESVLCPECEDTIVINIGDAVIDDPERPPGGS